MIDEADDQGTAQTQDGDGIKSSSAEKNRVDGPRVWRGDRVEIEITDLAFGGEGVGRHGELVVFVPYVAPGERVEVKITEVRKNFCRGVLAHLIEPSPDRVEPRCVYFGECGGCQYQHINYPAQLQWKRKQVADLMHRVGGISASRVEAVVPCPSPYGYRNRILVRSQWNRSARVLNLGYVRQDCGWVADVERCEIADPILNEALSDWRKNPPPKGGIKTVLRLQLENWEVPEHSFFQNNMLLLPQLLADVRQRLRAGNARYLVDAYCGVGFFGLELANTVERVIGVEWDAAAVRAARRNALNRGVSNAEFVSGDAGVELAAILKKFPAAESAVIIDPPRTGCPPQALAALKEAQPATVLYVSCHPATLARDLAILAEGGAFEVMSVTPYDMFPQTQHVECVVELRWRGK